jgi:hypothetical protein
MTLKAGDQAGIGLFSFFSFGKRDEPREKWDFVSVDFQLSIFSSARSRRSASVLAFVRSKAAPVAVCHRACRSSVTSSRRTLPTPQHAVKIQIWIEGS